MNNIWSHQLFQRNALVDAVQQFLKLQLISSNLTEVWWAAPSFHGLSQVKRVTCSLQRRLFLFGIQSISWPCLSTLWSIKVRILWLLSQPCQGVSIPFSRFLHIQQKWGSMTSIKANSTIMEINPLHSWFWLLFLRGFFQILCIMSATFTAENSYSKEIGFIDQLTRVQFPCEGCLQLAAGRVETAQYLDFAICFFLLQTPFPDSSFWCSKWFS